MGLRGMPEGELVFEDLEVPAEMVLLPPSGFRRGFGDLLNAYNSQRVGAGAVATGVAGGAFDLAVEWVKEREQFGRPIGEFQGLQWMLADMQIRLTASRLMLYAAARSRGPGGSAFPDPMVAAQAKIFASEAAIGIVNDALQIHGARGYWRDLPLERMARDVRMFTIGGGTAQVLRTLVASKVLGLEAAAGARRLCRRGAGAPPATPRTEGGGVASRPQGLADRAQRAPGSGALRASQADRGVRAAGRDPFALNDRTMRALPAYLFLYAALYGGWGVLSPFLPAVLAERGATPEAIGLLLAGGIAARLVSMPVAGALADRSGAPRLVLALLLIAGAAFGLG